MIDKTKEHFPSVFKNVLAAVQSRTAYKQLKNVSYIIRVRPDNWVKRTTPEYVSKLSEGEVFVFGSNLAGMHVGGVARVAYDKFGAILGQGVGLQGQSYAIPTMQGGIETVRPYVDEFIAFAKAHPELRFLVTRIGCGIAGFTDKDIVPLFEEAIDLDNVCLPREFWQVITYEF